MLSLKALETAGQDELPSKLRALRGTVEHMGREIHELALELRPVTLDELGLARALTSYLESWSARTGITADFVSAGIEDGRLPPQIETTLYRIVQEATNNVYKHAKASSVSVSIERRGSQVLALVEDNGIGFDVGRADREADSLKKIGIAGMRERAAVVDAEFMVESQPGHGTTVRVKVPLPS
jgi:signal transduction histidine kinase